MRPGRVGLLDDAADLGDFFHQVQLRRQAAGGVGEHDVDAARLAAEMASKMTAAGSPTPGK